MSLALGAVRFMARRVKKALASLRDATVKIDPRQMEFLVSEIRGDRPGPQAVDPSLSEFLPRWFREHVHANRQKPATLYEKNSILRIHLVPRFGERRLSEITVADVQALKGDLAVAQLSAKRVNNILTVLNTILGCAHRWGVIKDRPRVEFIRKTAEPEMEFYEFDTYAKAIGSARAAGPMHLLMTLLGGDAGLRMGEMMTFEAQDADRLRKQLNVRRADSDGVVTVPKSGKPRVIPMTDALVAALDAHPIKEGRLLVREDGQPVSRQTLRTWMERVQKGAGVRANGGLHVLRHTFCSHLAMRGAPPLAIKELAGHQSLRTTMRYMHLAPSEKNRAIDLLNAARAPEKIPEAPEQTAVSPRGFEFVVPPEASKISTSSETTIIQSAEATPRDDADSLTLLSQELELAKWGVR